MRSPHLSRPTTPRDVAPVCVCVCVRMCSVYMYVNGLGVCVYMYVYVCVRVYMCATHPRLLLLQREKRKRKSVCVCVRVRERERVHVRVLLTLASCFSSAVSMCATPALSRLFSATSACVISYTRTHTCSFTLRSRGLRALSSTYVASSTVNSVVCIVRVCV